MATTHTSCFRQILNLLFDFYYVLEIITFGNYNGLDAGPLTLLSPYILSLVNANGPTYDGMYYVLEILSIVCISSLQWRNNERDGVSNHRRTDCFLNRFSGEDQRKHQSSTSLAFVRGTHRWPGDSHHKGPISRKRFLLVASSCVTVLLMICKFLDTRSTYQSKGLNEIFTI